MEYCNEQSSIAFFCAGWCFLLSVAAGDSFAEALAAQGIVAALCLEGVGVCLEARRVEQWVVKGEGIPDGIAAGLHVGRQRRWCGEGEKLLLVVYGDAEVAADGPQCHAGGVALAVGGVSGYVRRGYECLAQQLLVDAGLALPGVDDHLAHQPFAVGAQQCLLVHHSAPCGIDDEGLAPERGEEGLVGQVHGGVGPLGCQRGVEGDDVALLGNLLQRDKSLSRDGAGFLQRRVVEQYAAANGLHGLAHGLAHVAVADYADGGCRGGVGGLQYCVPHILRHGGGVAARTVGPRYAATLQAVRVEVVVADGGRGNKLDAAVGARQGFVATGAGADDEGVGFGQLPAAGKGIAGQVIHMAQQPLGGSLYVGNLVVNQHFHAAKVIK